MKTTSLVQQKGQVLVFLIYFSLLVGTSLSWLPFIPRWQPKNEEEKISAYTYYLGYL
jgi:hypothetical protein